MHEGLYSIYYADYVKVIVFIMQGLILYILHCIIKTFFSFVSYLF